VNSWEDKIDMVISTYDKNQFRIRLDGYELYIKSGEQAYFKYIDQEIKSKSTEILVNNNEVENMNNHEILSILDFIYSNEILYN